MSTRTDTRRWFSGRVVSALLSPKLLVSAIVLFASVLRFYQLGGRSFWLDEIVTAKVVRFNTLNEVISWTHLWPDQVPLMNVLTWLLRGLGGSEWAVRLPSALAGSLTVLVIYALGSALAGTRVGLLAALIMSILPVSVWYGQEGRIYGLVMLFTTLQMFFAYRMVVHSSRLDGFGLGLSTALNLYSHNVALAPTAAVATFVGVVLIAELIGLLRSRQACLARMEPTERWGAAERRFARKVLAVTVAGMIAVLVYLPWLPSLLAFLGRRDVGLGLFHAGYNPKAEEVLALLLAFNFTGPVLLFLGVGLATTVPWLGGKRWREGLLLLLALGVPIGAFLVRLQGGIVTVTDRYFTFLLPTAVLLTALGVGAVAEVIASLVQFVKWHLNAGPSSEVPGDAPLQVEHSQRTSSGTAGMLTTIGHGSAMRPIGRIFYISIILLLLAQILPMLVQSYQEPKHDYRGATSHIINNSPSGSSVIVMGKYSVFVIDSIQHYLWMMKAPPIHVIDGAMIDDQILAQLKESKGKIWGAIFTAYPNNDLDRAPREGVKITSFVGLNLVEPVSTEKEPVAQVKALLHWGSSFQPELLSSADLLSTVSGEVQPGENLLPLPTFSTVRGGAPITEHWILPMGGEFDSERNSFALSPAGPMLNITFNTTRVAPGKRYVLSFRYRNTALDGEQRVYISAHSADGRWLDTFPSGGGYLCAPTKQWSQGIFAFTIPLETHGINLWLRATGTGTADFRAIELREVVR